MTTCTQKPSTEKTGEVVQFSGKVSAEILGGIDGDRRGRIQPLSIWRLANLRKSDLYRLGADRFPSSLTQEKNTLGLVSFLVPAGSEKFNFQGRPRNFPRYFPEHEHREHRGDPADRHELGRREPGKGVKSLRGVQGQSPAWCPLRGGSL